MLETRRPIDSPIRFVGSSLSLKKSSSLLEGNKSDHHCTTSRVAKRSLVIGDERLDEASGGWYDHVNPTTGLVQKRIPIAGTSEVDLAVGVAQRAFPAPWPIVCLTTVVESSSDFGSCFRAGSLGPNEQPAKLFRPMIIRYRSGTLSLESTEAALRHDGPRVCTPRGRVDRRGGGIDARRQLDQSVKVLKV
jgi:hypothetical protein